MHFHNFNNWAGELLNIEVTSLFERNYTYDPNGRMTEVTDATGTTELAYDIYGKILSETFPSPANTAVVRSFDTLQRPSGISLGNTPLAAYTYGTDGRLATLGNGTATLNYAYHPGTDQIASRSWQIGQNTPFLNMDNSFDDYSRVVEISANSTPEISYTLNDDNQRTAAALSDGSAWAYGYDTKGQLLTAVLEDSQNTTLNDMDYSYDGIGNRTEAEEDTVEKEYTSNLLNQYTSIETTSETPPITESPTYDADGNMLTNGPWTYTWNTESRLTSAISGTTVLEFQYDYMGRRIEKKVTENEVVTKQENYVYDGYKLIAIYDALNSNALIMTFVWQPIGLDVPLCMTYNGNTYYYLTDGNKNVTGLFDSTGTRVASYLYGPFGQMLSSTGAMASTNPFRFSSEFHDDETGLVYYNYRYYSPVLGRWTRRDPIGENGGANLYNFITNSPVSYTDSLGKENLSSKIIAILAGRVAKAMSLILIFHNWKTTNTYISLSDDENEIEGVLPIATILIKYREIIKKLSLTPFWKEYKFDRLNVAQFGVGNVLTFSGSFPSTGWWLNASSHVDVYGTFEARCSKGRREYRNVKLVYEWYDDIDANSFLEAMNKGAFNECWSGSTYINTIEGSWDVLMEKIAAVDYKIVIKGTISIPDGVIIN